MTPPPSRRSQRGTLDRGAAPAGPPTPEDHEELRKAWPSRPGVVARARTCSSGRRSRPRSLSCVGGLRHLNAATYSLEHLLIKGEIKTETGGFPSAMTAPGGRPASSASRSREQLVDQYELLLSNPRRNGDVVNVPTNSLFIEALPATHSLIERFKAEHRVIDVKSAQADTRAKELENVRLAARLLSTPQLLEDPTIERKVVVEGENAIVVPSDGN